MECLDRGVGYFFLPERLTGLAVGDVLVVRDFVDIEEEYNNNSESIRCGWNTDLRDLCGKEVTITEVIYNRIKQNDNCITELQSNGRRWGVGVGLDILEYKETDPKRDLYKTVKTSKEYSLKYDTKDESIIKEMIKSVDFGRFMQLMIVLAKGNPNSEVGVTKEYAQATLRRWAEAKYEYYLLFGRKLSISKEIEFDMAPVEFQKMVDDICAKYPRYALTLMSFNSGEWKSNEMNVQNWNHNDFFKIFPQYRKEKMKLTKLLAQLIGDNQLDIDISKMYQVSKVTGSAVLSIDPYDYLTMSINQHDWESCHNIVNGCYATGTISYMCDETTLIGYKSNNKTYNYNLMNKYKATGNSKSWRQCVFVDKETSAAIFGRQYPNTDPATSDTLCDLFAEQINTYLNITGEWVKQENSTLASRCLDNNMLHYNDVVHGYNYAVVMRKDMFDTEVLPTWRVGSDVFCADCGELIRRPNEQIVCERCDCDDYYDEDDHDPCDGCDGDCDNCHRS